MTDLATLNQQLYDLREQQRQAEAAEAARIAKERAAQDAIANLQHQIATVGAEQREAVLEDAISLNEQLLDVCADAADELRAALDALYLPNIREAFERYSQAVDRQQKLVTAAAGEYLAGARLPSPWGDNANTTTAPVAIRAEYARVYGRFQNALTPTAILARWVADVYDDANEKRIRQGIVYSLIGQVVKPVRDYDPQAATRARAASSLAALLRF